MYNRIKYTDEKMYQSYNSFGDIHNCYTEVPGAVAGRGRDGLERGYRTVASS